MTCVALHTRSRPRGMIRCAAKGEILYPPKPSARHGAFPGAGQRSTCAKALQRSISHVRDSSVWRRKPQRGCHFSRRTNRRSFCSPRNLHQAFNIRRHHSIGYGGPSLALPGHVPAGRSPCIRPSCTRYPHPPGPYIPRQRCHEEDETMTRIMIAGLPRLH